MKTFLCLERDARRGVRTGKAALLLAAFTLFLHAESPLLAQGSLTPPGPPESTMKTLEVGDGSKVAGCTVRQNGGDGIELTGGGFISGNLCDQNAAVSINATGFASRIEGNTVLQSRSGIRLGGSFNIVVKNTLGTGNPIVDVGGGNQIAPTQNAATATNPFANLVH